MTGHLQSDLDRDVAKQVPPRTVLRTIYSAFFPLWRELLSCGSKITGMLIFLIVLSLSIQLGKHFWPMFSFVLGQRIDYLSPTIYVTDVLIFFLFIFKLFQGKINISKKTYFYLLLLLPSTIFSTNIYESIYVLLKILEFLFLFFTIVSFKGKIYKQVLLGFGIGIIAEASIALFQYLRQGSIGGLLYFLGERTFSQTTPGIANTSINGQLILRPYGTFPHPNVLAGFLFIGMILCFYFLKQKREKIWKVFTSVVCVFGTLGIFLTLSRTIIFLWFLFFIIKIWRGVKKISKKKKLGILLVCSLAIVILTKIFPDVLGRFMNLSFGDESIVQREILNNASLSMFLKRPIFGVGIGSFVSALSSYESFDNLLFTLQPVHNIFLLVLSEAGILGLFVFASVLGQTLKIILKNFVNNFYLFFAFLSILFIGLFDHYFLTLEQGQLLFTLFLAICFRERQKLLE